MARFALVGHPVGHSMSKVMHEAAFNALKLRHTYDVVDVLGENLSDFVLTSDYSGLNVTIPHKVAVIGYLDGLSDEAKILGSANTVEIKDGKRIGHNTDVFGFMECAREAGIEVGGKNVLVAGSGGAGRAIAYKLAMDGSKVMVYDTAMEKAMGLAQDITSKLGIRVDYSSDMKAAMDDAEVFVNATPVGMHPKTDASPVPKALLRPDVSVIDIVYNPIETLLLKDARETGCKTAGGVGMLVHQGAQSLRIWLGIDPPIEVMRQAVTKRLSGR